MTDTPISDLSTALSANPGVERLYDNVQAQVPAIGLAAVKLALWNTIEDFYIQSTLAREHVYWKMAGSIQSVNFNPFDGYRSVVWVLGYTGLYNAKVEYPSVLRDLTRPIPGGDRSGEAWLVLKPVSFEAVQACNQFPELWSTWFETILAGTLYRLYVQPAKPFSNAQLAQFHGKMYRRGVSQARDVARRDNSTGRPTRFPYYARGRQ
jgi:hypothetical protein